MTIENWKLHILYAYRWHLMCIFDNLYGCNTERSKKKNITKFIIYPLYSRISRSFCYLYDFLGERQTKCQKNIIYFGRSVVFPFHFLFLHQHSQKLVKTISTRKWITFYWRIFSVFIWFVRGSNSNSIHFIMDSIQYVQCTYSRKRIESEWKRKKCKKGRTKAP